MWSLRNGVLIYLGHNQFLTPLFLWSDKIWISILVIIFAIFLANISLIGMIFSISIIFRLILCISIAFEWKKFTFGMEWKTFSMKKNNIVFMIISKTHKTDIMKWKCYENITGEQK